MSNLAYSSNGRYLASGGGIRKTGEQHNSVVKIWDTASGQLLREFFEGPFLALSARWSAVGCLRQGLCRRD